MGERLPCTQEVRGSIPRGSTNFIAFAGAESRCSASPSHLLSLSTPESAINTTAQVVSLCGGAAVIDSAALQQQLDRLGLEYASQGGLLMLPSTLELLDAKTIAGHFDSVVHKLATRLDIHLSIDSTNTYLMARTSADDFHGSICLAEMQVAGRGRRGRNWVSPFGKNIYLSIGWQMPENTASVSGLSLVIGMQAARSLRSIGFSEVGLKWPNDILYQQAKLAGILIEMDATLSGVQSLVIGIGVNLALSKKDAAGIDQPWSTLGQHSVSRNALVARLIENIFKALDKFSSRGFSAYQSQWPNYNVYHGRQVRVHRDNKIIRGIDRGVDSEGNLLLETDRGIESFSAGEVSLRYG